jgi:anaerobic magnesium-protoporphyrin IX monomethyl ester cyclase
MSSFKVLLINPPPFVSKKESRKMDKLFLSNEPFGLLSITAVLLEHQIDCHFLDARAEMFDINQTIQYIKKIEPVIIGIPILTPDAFVTEELLLNIQEEISDAIVVIGNLHASIFYDYYLRKKICDFVVHGEGELIMLNLCKMLAEKKDPGQVNGISFIKEDEIINTKREDLIQDLDSLPMIARHVAPMDKYVQKINHGANNKCFHMMTSRGCPIGCKFCCVHSGRKVRMNTADNVLDEIGFLVDKYGADEILFYDPMFLSSRDRTLRICEGIRKRFPKLTWKCEAHINFINEELLKELKASGCTMLFYGIETGNNELLKVIGKKTTIETITEKVNLTVKYGIKVYGFFILGIPGETREMSKKTIQLSLDLPLEFAQFTIFTPFPGSEMFLQLKDEKRIDPFAWDKYYTFAGFTDNDPIYTPDGRTSEEIKELQRKAIRSFHLRPKHIFKQALKLRPHNISQAITAFKMVVFSR